MTHDSEALLYKESLLPPPFLFTRVFSKTLRFSRKGRRKKPSTPLFVSWRIPYTTRVAFISVGVIIRNQACSRARNRGGGAAFHSRSVFHEVTSYGYDVKISNVPYIAAINIHAATKRQYICRVTRICLKTTRFTSSGRVRVAPSRGTTRSVCTRDIPTLSLSLSPSLGLAYLVFLAARRQIESVVADYREGEGMGCVISGWWKEGRCKQHRENTVLSLRDPDRDEKNCKRASWKRASGAEVGRGSVG